MPALRRHARRLQACRAGAHHDDALLAGRAGRTPVGFAFCAELRIVNLGKRLALMNLAPCEIVVARRPDVGDAAFFRLVRPVGIRDQCPREPDEIAGTLAERGFGLRRHGDAADGHHGLSAGGGPQLFVYVEERRAPEVHVRHVVLQAVGEVALAVGEIVERAVPGERRRDARRLLRIDAALDALLARHLEADHEVLPAARADRLADLLDEAHAVLQRAAVAVGAPVRPRRQDLRDQIAVRAVQLHPAEAAALEPQRDRDVGLGHVPQLVGRHDVRHGPAVGVGLVRDALGRPHRGPQLLAPRVPELADEARARALDRRRGALEALLVGLVVAGDDCAMRERRRIDGDHLADDRPAATLGALGQEVDPALGDAMARPEVRQRR